MNFTKKEIGYCVVSLAVLLLSCYYVKERWFKPSSELLIYIDKRGREKEVRSVADWKKKRTQILSRMQLVMGKLPEIGRKSPAIDTISVEKRDGYTKYDIRYQAALDEWVPAFLYVPDHNHRNTKLPAMLVLHSTGEKGRRIVDGESSLENRAYAKELAERGYIVIAPDYPGFGDMTDYDFSSDTYSSGTIKGVFNHIRAIDVLGNTALVDPDRIGVIGHSLGGHNAIFAASFDERIKVVVSSCGWTLFDYYDIGEAGTKLYGGKLGPWAQDKYMPWMKERYHLDPDKVPFDFDEAIAAIAPRAFFSNSPVKDANFNVQGVKEGVSRIAAVYRFLNAGQQVKVRYPDTGHDFPYEVRMEAYAYIDSILNHHSYGLN